MCLLVCSAKLSFPIEPAATTPPPRSSVAVVVVVVVAAAVVVVVRYHIVKQSETQVLVVESSIFHSQSAPFFLTLFARHPVVRPARFMTSGFDGHLWRHEVTKLATKECMKMMRGEPWWRQVHLPTRKARVKFHPSLYQRHPVIEKQQTILILSYGYYHYHVWSQSQRRR